MPLKEIPLPPTPKKLHPRTSVSWKPLHGKLYKRVFSLILEKSLSLNKKSDRQSTPFDFKTPTELQNQMNFLLGTNGTDDNTLLSYLEKVIKYSPHHSHPFYLGKDSAGLDPYALAGDFLSTVMCTPVLTYLFAPVFTLMEMVVKKELRSLVGYPNGEGDGIIVPGGGFSTLMAIRAAIHSNYPEIRKTGLREMDEKKFCIFVSEHANLSIEKACSIVGLGSTACISIPVDKNGRMDVNELKDAVTRSRLQELTPVMVIATLGTQTTGAMDPLEKIAQFCENEKIWLHVDGNYGGPYLFSNKLKEQWLKGVEKSHSFSMGMEGMLGAPYCTTILITSNQNLFINTFGTDANYLYGPDESDNDPLLLQYSKYDNGDQTIQTCRRPEVMKAWLMWKVRGKLGLGKHVEYISSLATVFTQEISNRPAFHLIVPNGSDTTRLGFYYLPSSIRSSSRSLDFSNPIMKQVCMQIKKKLLDGGHMYLGLSSSLPNVPEHFLISVTNSELTVNDIHYILDTIESIGNHLKFDSNTNSWTVNETECEFANIYEPPGNGLEPSLFEIPERKPQSNSAHFFEKLFNIIEENLYYQDKRSEAPLEFRSPEALLQLLDLSLGDESTLKTEDEVFEALQQIIKYSVHQAHPFYVFQLLSGGLDPYGVMADLVATTMKSGMLSYEDAPVYSLMEKEVLRAVRERIGYLSHGDGMICPGGSISVITALYIARYATYPAAKEYGLQENNLRLTLYVSKNAHYCSSKGAILQGIGMDNCVSIEVDEQGRMDVNALQKAILKTKSEGGTPFFVCATAGTTVLGVIDPLLQIAKICKEFGIWMHVDGTLGGSGLMSDRQLRTKLKGIELSDSINFNPTKWYGSPQEISVLVINRVGVVAKAFASKEEGSAGCTSLALLGKDIWNFEAQAGLQWGRRPNILKFWFLWKAKGIKGMGEHIEYTIELKEFLVSELKRPERTPMFRIWKDDFESAVVLFHYIPIALRGLDYNSEEFKSKLGNVSVRVAGRLTRAGVISIGVIQDGDSPMLLKIVLMSSGVTKDDIIYFLDQVDNFGHDIQV